MNVRAGGGVVWRLAGAGGDLDRGAGGAEVRRALEVVLVHRPKYDDWSFPKGKIDGDESTEQAALREVREETGLSCDLGPELPATAYVDGQGRPKTVRYWAMTPGPGVGDGPLRPLPEGAAEVDLAEWLPLGEARRRLSYQRDQGVLDAFERLAGEAGAEGGSTSAPRGWRA